MITALILLVVIVLIVLAFSPTAPALPLAPYERAYLILSVVPIIVTLVLPSTATLSGNSALRAAFGRMTIPGMWLSLGLIPVGLGLIWRRRRETGFIDKRLSAGVAIGGLPAFLLLLLVFLWRVR